MSRHPEQREASPGSSHAPTAAVSPHHRLSVAGTVGALQLVFEAELFFPWTVLFGPSGCGKSTILRSICGLVGHLDVHLIRREDDTDTVLQNDTVSTPPERRRIAYAPQNAVLFPHLTVRENVSFAQTVRRRSSTSPSLVPEAMQLFQLEALAGRRPRELSGGERQRVSLARALATPDARLLVLDEPFAGIDSALRDQLTPRLQAWTAHRGIPVLSVTHDIDEALLLDAEVFRLSALGRLLAHGPARTVLADEVQKLLRVLKPNEVGSP